MDKDVDVARADLHAIMLQVGKPKLYADFIWKAREKARKSKGLPMQTKSRWNWPYKSLDSIALEKKLDRERRKEQKNVIKFEKFVKKVADGEFKKIAKRR